MLSRSARIISPTSIYSCQRTSTTRSLLSIPRPRKVGFGQTNRTHQNAADAQTSAFGVAGFVSTLVEGTAGCISHATQRHGGFIVCNSPSLYGSVAARLMPQPVGGFISFISCFKSVY